MPLTIRQSQQWRQELSMFKNNVMTSISNKKWAMRMRLALLTLVDKTIRENLEEGSILQNAFEIYVEQLNLQRLKTIQFNQAILHFNKIPEVAYILNQLKENMILQIEQSSARIESDDSTSPATSTQSESSTEDRCSIAGSDSPGISSSERRLDFSLSSETRLAIISDWVHERYSPVDERAQYNKE